MVFAEFVGAMGELALLLVGTEAEFQVFFAELGLFLILPYGRLGKSGDIVVSGRGRILSGRRIGLMFALLVLFPCLKGHLDVSSQHISTLIVNYI